MNRENLALGTHTFLGDQQHNRANDQDRSQNIEDGGAHAASRRQLDARGVRYINNKPLVAFTVTETRSFNLL